MCATTMATPNDIFVFSSKSADAPPGKGAGETLTSSPEVYVDLRKMPGWRRLLASGDTTPLPLTGTAELWEGTKVKKRRTDLEEQRAAAQGSLPTVEEKPTMEAPKTKKPRGKSKKQQEQQEAATGNIGVVPEAAVTTGVQLEVAAEEATSEAAPVAVASSAVIAETTRTQPLAPEDEGEEKNVSSIRFCPVCRYYLYLQASPQIATIGLTATEIPESSRKLFRLCRNCGYMEDDVKGGLLSEIIVGERSAEGYKILYNEHTRFDPNLPHLRGVMKCPDPACDSNHDKAQSDIIYMKYDSVNLLYMYICNICAYRWRSRR